MREFDPLKLVPEDSINRVMIARLPFDAVDRGEVEGRRAYDLLSSEALARRIRGCGRRLGIGNAVEIGDRELLGSLDGWLASGDEGVRGEAEEIAGWFGRRLGYLLLTLKRGDRANREARPEWDGSRWKHWGGIEKVMLGGGIVSGEFGRQALEHTRRVLDKGGAGDVEVAISEYAAILPMVGVALGVQVDELGQWVVPVFDFGGTFAKRGYGVYGGGRLLGVRLLEPVKAREFSWARSDNEPEAEAREQLDYMLGVLADTWVELKGKGLELRPQLRLAIASYLTKEGQPGDTSGAFGLLRRFSEDVTGWLSERLEGRVGEKIEVVFQHDGTAAAAAYAGMRNTAVIMVGTALGFGFPHEDETGVCEVDVGFRVLSAEC